jgi:hypothetical protein
MKKLQGMLFPKESQRPRSLRREEERKKTKRKRKLV